MFKSIRKSIGKAIIPDETLGNSPMHKTWETVFNGLYGMSALSDLSTTTQTTLEKSKHGASLAFNMTVPVYTAVNYRVKTVGRTKWRVKDLDDNIISESDTAQPNGILARAIADFEQRMNMNFFGAWELSRVIAGETYIEFVPNRFEVITGLDWLNPLATSAYAPLGVVEYYIYQGKGERKQISKDMMLFDRQLNLSNEVVGQSPVEVAIRKAQTIINGDMTMLSHLRNNARAGMTVSPPIGRSQTDPKMSRFGEEDMLAIRDGIIKTMRGSGNHNSTVVLPFPVDINTYEIANVQPVIDLMDRVDKSIYEALSVPPSIAGNPDTSRFQRSEQDLIVAHEMIINELLDIQTYVNRVIIPRFDPKRRMRFEFDLSPFVHITKEDIDVANITRDWYGAGIIDKKTAISLNSGLFKVRGIDLEQLLESADEEESQPPPMPPSTPNATEDDTNEETPIANGGESQSKAHKHSEDFHAGMKIEYENVDLEKIIKELKAYRKYVFNGKSASKFECHYIIGEVYDDLESSDFNISEFDRQINTLIDTQKSINGLATQFKTDVRRILDTAKTRDSLFTQMNNLVTIMGNRAYAEGLMNAGVRDEPNEDDRTTINQVQERQTEFINNLADTMFGDNPPSDAQLDLKPDQWVNKTLYEFYHEGLLSGRANPMLQWQLNPEKENCSDCIRLNGQRHRALDWKQSGWQPKGSNLECTGILCGCEFVRTVGRSRGNF
jgi:phage portal protein BeeE